MRRPDLRNTGPVTGNDDDEALTWAGGRDPSHYETPEVKPPKPPKPGKAPKTAEKSADTVVHADGADETDDPDELTPVTSAPVLISLGILGGIYLLYTVGWFVSWQRLVYVDPDVLELTAFRIQQVLAILAPPLWFVVTLLFTRGRRPAVRLIWLLIGALALVPWSFTFGV
jgi:hypothetical protein